MLRAALAALEVHAVVEPPLALALTVLLFVARGEWRHAKRVRAAGGLVFGPAGRPRAWVSAAPALRCLAAALFTWGSTVLAVAPREPMRAAGAASERLFVLLDASRSMYLRDAGVNADTTRTDRARQVLSGVLGQVASGVRVSVGAFCDSFKPIVVDTTDHDVLANVCERLPLAQAFDEAGRTDLGAALKGAFEVLEPWPAGSTTLLVLTDGDSVPSNGLPPVPIAVADFVVIGVGSNAGRVIGGHSSCQMAAELGELAQRMRGVYRNLNVNELPPSLFARLEREWAKEVPRRLGRTEIARAAVTGAAAVLGTLWLLLPWLGGLRRDVPNGRPGVS